jgi:hypothetical protein
MQSFNGNTTAHNEYDTEQNIPEQMKNEDLRKEDRPPPESEYTNEESDQFTLYPDESLPYYGHSIFDYQT